jgi:TPR repeat protein
LEKFQTIKRSIAMINHTNHRIVLPVLLVVAFALTGCGKFTQKSPPKQQVRDAVAAVLPPFLSLDSIELEPISTGPESVKVNFKAIVAPKEDLYQVDREVEGTPKVTLLKVVQAAGTKVSLYGFIEATHTVDRWTLGLPHFEGDNNSGEPRSTFPAQAYVSGSNEAKAALEQQERNRIAQGESRARAEKALKDRQEQARIAFEEQQKREAEQRKVEEEKIRQKLMQATVPGTRYVGTISDERSRQRIWLVFTEQNGFLIRAKASNPDDADEKRTFTGEIVLDTKPRGDNRTAHQIRMSPADGGPNAPRDFMHKKIIGGTDLDRFYYNENQGWAVEFDLTDNGLAGTTSGGLTIRLQRVDPPPAITPSHTASESESDTNNHIAFDEGQFADSRTAIAAALALKRNQEQADEGDPAALHRMGERYRDGDGVKKDLAKAAEYFKKADVAAEAMAKRINEENKLKEQAAKQQNFIRILVSADRGSLDSMIHVGKCYRDGDGVEKDLNKAREYFRKAAGLPGGDFKTKLEAANLISTCE